MKKVVRHTLEDTAKMSNPTAAVVGAVDALHSENLRSKKRDGKLLERLFTLRLQAAELAASTEEKRRNKEQYEKLLKKATPILWALMKSEMESTFGNGQQPSVSRITRPTTSREAVTSVKKLETSLVKDATDTSFEEEFQPITSTPPKPIQPEQFFTPLKQERPKHTEKEIEKAESVKEPKMSEVSIFVPLPEPTFNNSEPKEPTVRENEVTEGAKAIQKRMAETVDRKSPPPASGNEVSKIPDNPSLTMDAAAPKVENQDVSQVVESPKIDAKGLTTYATLLLDQKSPSTAQKQDSSPELPLKKEITNTATVNAPGEARKPKISIFRADSDSESIGPPLQGAFGGQLSSTNDFDDFWD